MKNLRTNLFDFTTVKLPVRQGSVIISTPTLREKYFIHAVVSIIDYDTRNTCMGVVLNNCTALCLNDIVDNLHTTTPIPVYCGGPLSHDRLFFVHTLGDDIIPGATEYTRGLWVGGDYDAMLEYVSDGYPLQGTVRFFLGYTGWTCAQLDNELQDDVWAVMPEADVPDASVLLGTSGDRMWHAAVRAMGPRYRNWRLQPISVSGN